jgi:hypothetical protein
MTPMHGAGRVVVRVLCIVGLLALGYATYVVFHAKYQAIEHQQLERASPNVAARAVGQAIESWKPSSLRSCDTGGPASDE